MPPHCRWNYSDRRKWFLGLRKLSTRTLPEPVYQASNAQHRGAQSRFQRFFDQRISQEPRRRLPRAEYAQQLRGRGGERTVAVESLAGTFMEKT